MQILGSRRATVRASPALSAASTTSVTSLYAPGGLLRHAPHRRTAHQDAARRQLVRDMLAAVPLERRVVAQAAAGAMAGRTEGKTHALLCTRHHVRRGSHAAADQHRLSVGCCSAVALCRRHRPMPRSKTTALKPIRFRSSITNASTRANPTSRKMSYKG